MKNQSITLKPRGQDVGRKDLYEVVSATNRLEPKVGKILTEVEVRQLMDDRNLTVHVKK